LAARSSCHACLAIRLLFVGSRFRSTLPSDGPSFRPCASLVLHLHQVAQGTFTPKLLGMPSTQPHGFTVSQLAEAVGPRSGQDANTYSARNAAWIGSELLGRWDMGNGSVRTVARYRRQAASWPDRTMRRVTTQPLAGPAATCSGCRRQRRFASPPNSVGLRKTIHATHLAAGGAHARGAFSMTKLMIKPQRRQGLALGTALAAVPPVLILASTGPAHATKTGPFYCAGVGQCVDEHQPAVAVRFGGFRGLASADSLLDVLAPNNELRSGESG
jgi:hypothetical protein